jgi:hypothetical protein
MFELIGLLTHLLVGQVDRASNRLTARPGWRVPITLFIIASAAWVAYASAYLWTNSAWPGVVGLLVALGTVVAALLPIAGRYGLVLVLQFSTFVLSLVVLATFAPGPTDSNWPLVSSVLVTMPASILAIVTALGDVVPLDSPLVYCSVTYWGRTRCLRALERSARRLGWQISTPTGDGRVYTTGGYLGSRRDAQVVSGWNLTHPTRGLAGSGYWVKLQISLRRPTSGAIIGRQRLPKSFAARAITGKVQGGILPLRYSIISYRKPPGAEWQSRFTQQIAAGATYLRGVRDIVHVVPGGLRYAHFSPFSLARRYGEIEPLADWLASLATLLEELAPDAPVEPPAPLGLLPPSW